MAAGYVALPAYRAPSAIDWSPLGEAFDTIGKARERNRLLAEQRELGASLMPQAQPSQPQSAPVNPLMRSPAQYQSGSVVDRIVGAESGGNAYATNPRSSATGAGQFISSTWLDQIKRNRPDLAAGKSDADLLAMRTDPNLSREMTQRYADENGSRLRGAGFEATPGNTYLSHFAGPQGSLAVLRADPNAPVRGILGDRVVQANPFLANMTAGDLRAWADRKMGGQSQRAASPAPAPTSGRSGGMNYEAGIRTALQQGNVALATQLQNAQQEAEQLAYTRQRQGVQDAQSAESHGLNVETKQAELQQNFAKRVGGIAQTIQSEADPARKAQMWQRFVSADPRIARSIASLGIDVNDVDAGTRMLIAEAQGVTTGKGLTEVSPGATLYDPARNQAVYTAPAKPGANRPIEVGGNLVQEQPDGSYKSVYTAPVKARNLSVAEQKEVFDADEGVQASKNVIGALDKALLINDKAYSGPAAQTRGYIGSLVGAEGGLATEELQNVVLQQVLDSLKSTFGSAPTEGERQILVDVQGSVSKAPEVRKRIFENAKAAAQRRLEFNQNKANAIRSGEYFQAGYGQQAVPQPQQTAPSVLPSAAPSGGPQPGQVEDGYIFKGGDPANPASWEKVN